ncbi:hypothetical protein K443DRAFT_131735 [Laccaria amethystina LaAM-08-1]|uniref:Uncharacterized protein n=1 Tax=Laccaria amethystina LaAM-08-1 TaxID=1095629 RepID=A0A0C9WUA1_9AGAR|nr:hypothetical protein K443DRAFT_131735 [Laccaria amethystina LaAM-08-1]
MVRVRYSSVAGRLPKLPRELVHKILDDISLVKVLELVSSHDIPYIDECVSTHFHLRQLLPPDVLPEAKSYFLLYNTLCERRRRQPLPNLPQLAHDAQVLLQAKPSRRVDIIAIIKVEILKDLEAYAPFFPYSVTWLWDLFNVIDASEKKLNAVKSDQLKRMAELMVEYPGMLRDYQDPSQEQRRNADHTIAKLLLLSERIKRPQMLSGKFVGRYIFIQHNFHLVPYDRYLGAFLKVLDRFPSEDDALTEESIADQESKNIKDRNRTRIPHKYPKTLFTKYSGKGVCSNKGFQQPRFCLRADKSHATPPLGAVGDRSLLPASEKEVQWLEAFLVVCKHMSEMEEEWKAGETVGEYWKTHV